jgi:leader peptidase (prepilin peptidase)/N-methyltransferase
MEALGTVPRPVLAGAALLLGLAVGSFLNVVIHRLPRDESVVFPGSHCPACGTPLRWFDNLPLLSYVLLRGRCRACRAAISWRYPAIELVTGVLFAVIALRHGADPMTPVWWAFAAALVAAAAIDFDHRIIPDEISLGGLVVALLLVPVVRTASGGDFVPALASSLLGAVLGGGLFWLVGFVHARISVALGREFAHWPGEGQPLPTPRNLDYWIWFPGIGFGDVKLLAMIGAVLGPFGVLQTILAASLAGLALGSVWAAVTRSFQTPFGFGPAIAVGALLVVLVSGLVG